MPVWYEKDDLKLTLGEHNKFRSRASDILPRAKRKDAIMIRLMVSIKWFNIMTFKTMTWEDVTNLKEKSHKFSPEKRCQDRWPGRPHYTKRNCELVWFTDFYVEVPHFKVIQHLRKKELEVTWLAVSKGWLRLEEKAVICQHSWRQHNRSARTAR